MPAENPPCPECGTPTRRIVYGLPGEELFAAAARGEVALGGCLVRPQRWRCPACHHELPSSKEPR